MRPTKDPHTRPAINTLERLHAELGGKILENRQRAEELGEQMQHVEACITSAAEETSPVPEISPALRL